jgi:hypothetical protein
MKSKKGTKQKRKRRDEAAGTDEDNAETWKRRPIAVEGDGYRLYESRIRLQWYLITVEVKQTNFNVIR